MSRSLVPVKQRTHEANEDVDFAVSIKVRNGRLLAAIRRAGFPSVYAFCRKHGLSQPLINAYVTMTRSPLRMAGDDAGKPSKIAQTVADLLGAGTVEELFPPRFLATCLSRIAVIADLPMTEDQIGMLLQQPPQTPEDVLALDEAAATIHDTLVLLPPRQERLLRLRYGMNVPEHTLEETAKQIDSEYGGPVTRERIRQIEINALGKLRRPHAHNRLAQAADAMEIGVGKFRFVTGIPRAPLANHEAGILPTQKERAPRPQPEQVNLPRRSPLPLLLPKDEEKRRIADIQRRAREARERQAEAERWEAEQEARRLQIAAQRHQQAIDEAATLNRLELQRRLGLQRRSEEIARRGDGLPDPDWLRLLRVPAPARTREQMMALAYHLEREFIRRGAGAMRASTEAADYLRGLGPEELAMAKYDWFMLNLPALWQRFPPAPIIVPRSMDQPRT